MQTIPTSQPTAVHPPVPYARRLARTKSLESIVDSDPVKPCVTQSEFGTLPHRRVPPRPPPPRRLYQVSPDKPAIPQRTVVPPAKPLRRLTPVSQRKSVPSLPSGSPTPKERSSKWRLKNKQHN